jgi:hypothetical protein
VTGSTLEVEGSNYEKMNISQGMTYLSMNDYSTASFLKTTFSGTGQLATMINSDLTLSEVIIPNFSTDGYPLFLLEESTIKITGNSKMSEINTGLFPIIEAIESIAIIESTDFTGLHSTFLRLSEGNINLTNAKFKDIQLTGD